MSNLRLPGIICEFTQAVGIDTGTLCLAKSPTPGVLSKKKNEKLANNWVDIPSKLSLKLSNTDFEDAAKNLGENVNVAIIRAFSEVESGGKSGMGYFGLPIIAFEGHTFRRESGKKYDSTHPLLSYKYIKKAGLEWKINNKNQKSAWRTLKQALTLDHNAALKACSWGMFQVMGFNFKDCGYKNVDDFVIAMKAGERGQLNAFVGFCKSKKELVQALKDKDFKKMAIFYNGKDFGDYDKRIEKSYKKHGGV